MFGPAVTIATVGHPIHPGLREYMYCDHVTIGNNCWIGANSVICPGVTIGDNTVIGAGSVVTKDIPANCVAAGNPCKVIRPIGESDMKDYYRDPPRRTWRRSAACGRNNNASPYRCYPVRGCALRMDFTLRSFPAISGCRWR